MYSIWLRWVVHGKNPSCCRRFFVVKYSIDLSRSSLSLSSSFLPCLCRCVRLSLSFQALHCSVKVLFGILIACNCVTMSQEQGFHGSLQLALLTYAPRWATGLWLFNVFFVTTCSFLTTVCCRVYLLLLLTVVAFELLNFLLLNFLFVCVCVCCGVKGMGDVWEWKLAELVQCDVWHFWFGSQQYYPSVLFGLDL